MIENGLYSWISCCIFKIEISKDVNFCSDFQNFWRCSQHHHYHRMPQQWIQRSLWCEEKNRLVNLLVWIFTTRWQLCTLMSANLVHFLTLVVLLQAEISSSQLKSAQEPDTKIHDKTKFLKKRQRTVLS